MPIVKITDVGSVGYISDIPAQDLSEQPMAWSLVRNAVFHGGMAERVKGYGSGFGTVAQIPYFLLSATKTDGTPYVIAASTATVYSYTGSTSVNLTGGTTPSATADTRWTGGILTGFVILNEGVTAPHYVAISSLGSASSLADLTNWPASTYCKVLRPFKNYLVAGYMTEGGTAYPYKIRWSKAAVPGALPADWVASATNDAGSQDLGENDGEIIDIYPLGDQMFIFRRSGVWSMRYVGGTDATNRLVMAFNRVQSSGASGMLANNCGAVVPGKGLIALSESDVYMFNGSSAESIINNRMRRYLFSSIDSTNRKRSFVTVNDSDSEVLICYPTSGATSCTQALVWNYADNTFGIRDLPTATCGAYAYVLSGSSVTWGDLTSDWTALGASYPNWSAFPNATSDRKLIIGSAATKIYVIGQANDAAGSTLTSQLDRTGISFGDPEKVKYVKSIWPRFDATVGQTIDISVGASMWPDESPTYGNPQTYTVGTSRKVDVNVAGRYLALRIRSTTGNVWRLRSLEADVVPQGMY